MEELNAIKKAFDVFVTQTDEIIKNLKEKEKAEKEKAEKAEKEKPTKVLLAIPAIERLHDLPDEENFTLTDSIRWLLNDGTAVTTYHRGIRIEIIEDGEK